MGSVAVAAVAAEPVWAATYDAQSSALRDVAPRAQHVALNVQYPGCVVFHRDGENYHDLEPAARYKVIRDNVNALKPLQVGLAIRTDDGQSFAWEFNLRDFDVDSDVDERNPKSIEYLAGRGLDFGKLRKDGIDGAKLRELLLGSGLLSGGQPSWVTFTGAYHVAYLARLVLGEELPVDVDVFTAKVRDLLGPYVYDAKRLSREDGQGWGSLKDVASQLLHVPITPPGEEESGLAGATALLTLQVFEALKEKLADDVTLNLCHELCGLQAI